MTSIRQITQADVPAVQHLASEPTLAATTNLPSPYPSDGAQTWFDRITTGIAAGRQMVFAVEDAGKLIGVMSLNSIDHERKQCALDYWIGKPFWGEGHGTAAARLAIGHAQHQLGIQIVTSACLQGNIGSQRVLEKCGFQLTRTAPYNGPFPDRFGQQPLRHYRLEMSAN